MQAFLIKHKRLLFLLLWSLLPLLLHAETYYVNCNGDNASDANKGGKDTPWRTIRKANFTVKAGDTVIVKAGIYHEWIRPEASGTKDAWIVYKASPPQEVILDGLVPLDSVIEKNCEWHKDSSVTDNVWLIKLIHSAFQEAWIDDHRMPSPFPYPCDTLEFSTGMSFIDSSAILHVWLPDDSVPKGHKWEISLKSGIWLFPKDEIARKKFVVIDGFITQNFGLAGISVALDHVKILNNTSRWNGRGGVEIVFCNHVLVEDNEAYENCKGIGFSQGFTAYGVFGKEIYFKNNISHDNYDGADPRHCGTDGSGFILDTCPPQGGAVFVNNVAYRNMGSGFGVFQASNGYFINNTSFNNGLKNSFVHECHVGSTPEHPSDTLVFRNNIFLGRNPSTPVLKIQYTYNQPPQEVLFDHNLYFAPEADTNSLLFELEIWGGGEQRSFHLSLPEFQNVRFPTDTGDIVLNWGYQSLVAQPQLKNPRTGGFSLKPTSPAIDKGSELLAPAQDYFGTQRPQGNGYDIGACEYTPESKVENNQIPNSFSFELFPNPTKGNTSFIVYSPHAGIVKIHIYNILGQQIRTITENIHASQTKTILWNARNSLGKSVAAGLYFAIAEMNSYTKIRKILIIK